jgi:hypothetical protein
MAEIADRSDQLIPASPFPTQRRPLRLEPKKKRDQLHFSSFVFWSVAAYEPPLQTDDVLWGCGLPVRIMTMAEENKTNGQSNGDDSLLRMAWQQKAKESMDLF